LELLPLKNIERLRDRVAELKGDIALKIMPPTGRDYYTLTFDPEARIARFMKVTSCGGDQRETIEETWPSNMFDVLNTKGVAVRAEFSNGSDAKPLWFEVDDDALRKMYSLLLAEQPSN
jgi:hypothetical protein